MTSPPFAERQMHEPISSVTQFAAMPFAGAVAGWLKEARRAARLRVVLHRTFLRHGQVYLQQASPYLGDVEFDPLSAGRILALSEGIIGHAYLNKGVARTPYYPEAELLEKLASSDKRPVDQFAKAYVAIPMVTSAGSVAVVLYADSHTPNLFADNEVVQHLIGMCRGFCAAMDTIVAHPPERIRNFSFQEGELTLAGEKTVYALQELMRIDLPQFKKLETFNFEILS